MLKIKRKLRNVGGKIGVRENFSIKTVVFLWGRGRVVGLDVAVAVVVGDVAVAVNANDPV